MTTTYATAPMLDIAHDIKSLVTKRRDSRGKYLSAQDIESLMLHADHVELCDWHGTNTINEMLTLMRDNLHNHESAEYAIQYNEDTTFTMFRSTESGYKLVGCAAANCIMRNSETHPYQLVPDNDMNHVRMVTLPMFLRILDVIPGRTIDSAIQTPGTLWSFYGPAITD